MKQHIIKLEGKAAHGARIPLSTLGKLAIILQDVAQRSLRLSLENRSHLQGKPNWLNDATEIELVGLESGSTTLICEAPTFGESAPAIFDQQALWEGRIQPDLTALSLVEATLSDAANGKTDSELLDRNTLDSLLQFRDLLHLGYDSLSFSGVSEGISAVSVTPSILQRLELLRDEAPPPQRAVIVGILDQLTGSKRAFQLLMTNGQTVRGVLPQGNISSYASLFQKKVTVDGEASYRLSGKLALITASHIQIATEADKAFEHLPRPRPRSLNEVQPRLLPAYGTNGMGAVFGRFSTDETDEEIFAALQEMK